jgi:hypothetical protein
MAPNALSYRYDRVAAEHSVFCMPGGTNGTSTVTTAVQSATLAVMLPDGSWFDLLNRPSLGGNSESYLTWSQSPGSVAPHDQFGLGFGENVGGGYSVIPCALFQRQMSGRWLGVLDGVYAISGFGNGSENTGSIAGDDFVVFQNCYRADSREFWALKTE